MVPKMTTGLKSSLEVLSPCHTYTLEKAYKKSFKSNFELAEFAGKIMHSEVFGPLQISIEGHRYFCTFLDHYFLYTCVACVLSKKTCCRHSLHMHP